MKVKLFVEVRNPNDMYRWDEHYAIIDTSSADDAPIFDALNDHDEDKVLSLLNWDGECRLS
jgi:hypothetical protein